MDNHGLSKKEIGGWLVVVALAVTLLSWCQLKEDEPDYVQLKDIRDRAQWDVPAGSRETVEQAVQNYLAFCHIPPHELRDMTQLSVALVSDLDPSSYWVQAHGWRDRVDVSFTVRANAPGRAAGHRLRYSLGGGQTPGVVAMKDQAISYCLRLPSGRPGANLFAPVPSMKVIDSLH